MASLSNKLHLALKSQIPFGNVMFVHDIVTFVTTAHPTIKIRVNIVFINVQSVYVKITFQEFSFVDFIEFFSVLYERCYYC